MAGFHLPFPSLGSTKPTLALPNLFPAGQGSPSCLQPSYLLPNLHSPSQKVSWEEPSIKSSRIAPSLLRPLHKPSPLSSWPAVVACTSPTYPRSPTPPEPTSGLVPPSDVETSSGFHLTLTPPPVFLASPQLSLQLSPPSRRTRPLCLHLGLSHHVSYLQDVPKVRPHHWHCHAPP